MNKPLFLRSLPALFASAALLVLLGSPAAAQPSSGSLEKPAPPLVAAPAEYAHWKITASPLKTEAPPAPDPKKPELQEIEIRKGPATACMTQRWTNGKLSEAWIAEGYHLAKYPALPDIYVTSLVLRPAGLNDGMADFHAVFPGFVWLEEKFFAGTEKKDGRLCHHYVDGENAREAWVDAESRLPVAFRRDNTLFTYVSLPRPSQPPALPDQFQRELARHKKADAQ
jgi:hypothetical protein